MTDPIKLYRVTFRRTRLAGCQRGDRLVSLAVRVPPPGGDDAGLAGDGRRGAVENQEDDHA